MSVNWYVYLRDEDLPSYEQWQQEIDRRAIDLKLDKFSPRDQFGFLPAKFNGAECGFEYSFGDVDETANDGPLEEIGNRDRVATFTTHGGQDVDFQTAMLAAAVLAALTNGVYEGGGFAKGEEAFNLIRDQENADRERRRIYAEEKWANITARRCPECGAPCPEYRRTCKVCGLEVGRV
jgi:hypothetical protein